MINLSRYKQTEMQIEESYNHIYSYLHDGSVTKELRKMCETCEIYNGKDHDYEECRDNQCFRFWLAYEYLEWANSYE